MKTRAKKSLRGREVFTTGEVAKLLNFSARTISKLFDAGRIRGYRIPGSQDRRIPLECLMAFLKQNNMPVPRQLLDVRVVVLIGFNHESATAVSCTLPLGFTAQACAAGFDAALLWGEFVVAPPLAVLDLTAGRADMLQLARLLRAHKKAPLKLAVVACEDETEFGALGELFDRVICRPCDWATVAKELAQLAVE